MATTQWFSELEMEESSFFQQWEEAAAADSLHHFTEEQLSILGFGQQDQQQLAAAQAICTDKPCRKVAPKSCSWDSCITTTTTTTTTTDQSSSPSFLSFSTSDVEQPSHLHDHHHHHHQHQQQLKKEEVEISFPHHQQGGGVKRKFQALGCEGLRKVNTTTTTTTRPVSQNQEHIIAERKRREKLSQRFIALSAIIPGLKKMDKASVLGDAIKYLKQLQEKVTTLEEQSRKRTVETAVLVKKLQLSPDDESSSSDGESSAAIDGPSRGPEIEAKMSEKSVLVKIHCENRKGLLVRALSEIESHRLAIVSTSVVPFASSSIDITVMAQVEEGFSMTVKDLVKNLNTCFK